MFPPPEYYMYADVYGPESYVASVCSSDPRCVAYDWSSHGHDRLEGSYPAYKPTGPAGPAVWRLCAGIYFERSVGSKMCVAGTENICNVQNLIMDVYI